MDLFWAWPMDNSWSKPREPDDGIAVVALAFASGSITVECWRIEGIKVMAARTESVARLTRAMVKGFFHNGAGTPTNGTNRTLTNPVNVGDRGKGRRLGATVRRNGAGDSRWTECNFADTQGSAEIAGPSRPKLCCM